ncbi:GH116 family glycosyl hydrolase, partial [Flavihumibacter sp. CACIAM 22H1]|uniref:GH116 family glycosyl hydrolase n=1 Tax=Flavihumibacter sp. CACIAM 22H1 TaxID=1812911 RepID=UPI0007A84038
FSYIDQGFAVSITQNGKTIRKELSKKDFDDISFTGEYPLAKIDYSSRKSPISLGVEATVYSPFIPLNARESATPATVLQYKLTNRSNQKMEVSLTGWLQNLVGIDLKNQVAGNLRNRVQTGQDRTSVTMDLVKAVSTAQPARVETVFENFESGTYGKWKAEGNAFGKMPVTKAAAEADFVSGHQGNFLVNSKLTAYGDSGTGKLTSPVFVINSNFINLKVGGGPHHGKTCVNLFVDNKLVKTITGSSVETLEPVSWDVKQWKGKKAYLQLVDDEMGSWGHINVDEIRFSNLPATERFFPGDHPYYGNISLSVLGTGSWATARYIPNSTTAPVPEAIQPFDEKLVGAAGTSLELAPGESKEITFLLSWFFPNRPKQYGEGGNWNKPIPTEGEAIGNMYANWFDHSLDVASWLQANLPRLQKETFLFHDTYYNNSTLPYWLNQRIMMPVSTLATETCQWWSTDKFWAWEGVGSCVGTCTHVWNYAQAVSRLFPELERNIREKTDYGTSFQEDGGIQARNGWGGILIDGHAGAILKAYREHLQSKNEFFLSRNWDRIKKATEFIIKEDGNADGLIEKEQANTYDIAFFGANTYVGGLYLGALKAASNMALLMKDTVFAKRCDSIFNNGSKGSVAKLWNGEYFIQDVDLTKHPLAQYGTGCLSDQLFGQTWAHLNNLGYLYPENMVKTTLQSVWNYNWAPDVAVQTKVHKPERDYAHPGEAGLFIATWPKSKHMGEDGVRYRDEVWTGIEYQVATNMIYEGMLEEGLSLVKAVHDRYNPAKHNPWNEIECGDHYARALASWGVLLALQDYTYDGPAKRLSFAPRMQPDQFKSFFTAAEGWGNITQTRTGNEQENTIKIAWGKLSLQSIGLKTASRPASVTARIGSKEIPLRFNYTAQQLQLSFDEQQLQAGDQLTIRIKL